MCRRYALCLVAFVTLTLVPRAAVSGPLAVWGTAPLANTRGDFTSLAAGGFADARHPGGWNALFERRRHLA